MKDLYSEKKHPAYGGKINQLIALRELGAVVPDGLILSADRIMSWLREVWPELSSDSDGLDQLLKLDKSLAAERLQERALDPVWLAELEAFYREGQVYIVRSSALMEDHTSMSFAGQYDSLANCGSLVAIEAGIRSCILSLFNPEAQAYWQRQDLSWQDLGLAVLIQEQLTPDFSGVCFSLDLQSNQDQTMLIEYVAGGAEGLVSGRVNPQRLRLSWYQPAWPEQETCLLPAACSQQLHQQVLTITAHFGRPMDMEWCFAQGQLYLVQARPITMLPTKVEQGRWTTANFRDGGVAAQPCPNLMWSLYHASWQQALSSFLEKIGLQPPGPMPELTRLHFARPYWNLGVVKQGMEQIPGYIERDFDDELGVHKDYQGKGYVSKLTPSLLLHFLGVAWRTQRVTKDFLQAAPEKMSDLRQTFSRLEEEIRQITAETDLEQIEKLWKAIVTDVYLDCEVTYFWQAYINTVQLSMKKTRLLKWLSLDEFFQLIAHLGQLSHTKPLAAILAIADIILSDQDLTAQWQQLSLEDLLDQRTQAEQRPDFQALAAFELAFGHHSSRELDLRVPSYREEPAQMLEMLQRLVTDRDYYETALAATASKDPQQLDLSHLSPGRRKKIQKIRRDLRELLWWREEFKDCSTYSYHLIRQVSLCLGRAYAARGYLTEAEDIFYLRMEELTAFMQGHQGADQLQTAAGQNRHYCQSYRNLEPVGDLTEKVLQDPASQEKGNTYLTGMPASSGRVTGRVRVLQDLADIQKIEPGEILVTRYTDTGWSYVFGILGGLVTEYGGVLCHASIVARECGIPALVCTPNATQLLRTGMLISLNAEKGEIHIHEE